MIVLGDNAVKLKTSKVIMNLKTVWKGKDVKEQNMEKNRKQKMVNKGQKTQKIKLVKKGKTGQKQMGE